MSDRPDTATWDPQLTEQFMDAVGPLSKVWFRWEVRGLEVIPPLGGALLVSNHSGGMLTPDVLIWASAYYAHHGYDRPLYTLGHDGLFSGPQGEWLARIGLIRANHETAVNALRSGAIVLV